jgi:hypothetical protein
VPSEEEEPDFSHIEFTEDRGESAASSLLQEILGDEENLDSVVEKANPQELTLADGEHRHTWRGCRIRFQNREYQERASKRKSIPKRSSIPF